MFLDELSPLVQELLQKPVAFMGGFASGLFRLNLGDDPVKGWLDKELGSASSTDTDTTFNGRGNGGGPQSITIE